MSKVTSRSGISPVRTGLDLVERSWPKDLKNLRLGLLIHPASVNSRFSHATDILLNSKKCRLKVLFGPQHGLYGETQDNMIEWEGFRDKKTGLPVYSLYGKNREPNRHMLSDIDAVAVDMQDVGARYYTFIWTLALVMKVCEEMKKAVIVFDRPNPIGGHLTEGPASNPAYLSFVGLHPLPVRHGMTIAEIALYLKSTFYPQVDLYIIKMHGWKRKMWFNDTRLPWIMPSPNMPTMDTATVYPGMCLLEGTNISEGRGTTRPFETFGAPYIDPDALVKKLSEMRLPGVVFRPISYIPTFQKYAGQFCGGAQIHVINKERFKPFLSAVCIIKTIRELYREHFAWRNPPYEYEYVLLPFDILAGTDRVRRDIENGMALELMQQWWEGNLETFNRKIRNNFLLY